MRPTKYPSTPLPPPPGLTTTCNDRVWNHNDYNGSITNDSELNGDLTTTAHFISYKFLVHNMILYEDTG